jgi:uncharacterized damage-inducible protein DinB
MSTREFFTERFRIERPAFEKVIRALPDDQLGYRPTERNSAAGDVAFFLTSTLRYLVEAFDTGEIHRSPGVPPHPATSAAIADEYAKQADALEKRLASMDDAQWNRDAGMYFGDKLVRTMKARDIAWMFLFDAIHHRGQLTAYLRPMGGKVPAVYGPSADEKGS